MSGAPVPRAHFGAPVTALVYTVLTALVLIPIFSVHVPCLGDYLNHLARVHILLTIGSSGALQRFYDSHWHVMPYLGMDVPVAAFAQVMNIYAAGRLFVALCVLMPVLAAATLHYALYHRVGLVPALAFLLSYNFDLALGFLTYLFSACLAVMLFAGWIAAAPWPPWRRGVAFMVPAALLFLSHSFAFPVYALLVLGWELALLPRWPWRNWRVILADAAAAALQAAVPIVLSAGLHVGGTYGRVKLTLYGSIGDRIADLISPVYFPGPPGLLLSILCATLAAILFLGLPRLPAPIKLPLGLTVMAALAAPHVLLNVWGTDLRLPLVAAIVLIGAAAPPPRLSSRGASVVMSGLVALIAARAITAGQLLRGLDTQVAEMRAVVAALPVGQRLLVVDAPQDAPGRLAPRGVIQHMGMVAAIDRDAFLPSLFVGTAPLSLLPSMQGSASQGLKYIDFVELQKGLAAPDVSGPLPDYGYGGQMYWLGWPQKFDYVLVMNFGGTVPVLPSVLHQVAGNDVASLYRIATQ